MGKLVSRRSMSSLALVAAFVLACGDENTTGPRGSSVTGSIRVAVSATGDDIPTDFTLNVAGRVVLGGPTAAPLTVNDLPPGAYSLRVFLASNCDVVGEHPRTVVVSAGATTPIEFSVTCALVSGSLRVTTSTTGTEGDPDGYLVRIDGTAITGVSYQRTVPVPATGTVTIPSVPKGLTRVALTGVSLNCDVVGTNQQSLSMAVGQTNALSYDVSCASLKPQVAYVTISGPSRDIRVANVDGTNERTVTSDLFTDEYPAWSPDGSRLAFTTERDGNREIYVIDPDGSNAVRLTNDPGADFQPAWSPDGKKIAFVSNRFGDVEIAVMNADGTNVVRLTNYAGTDRDPAWSPDGRTIAFASEREGPSQVYVMDATGAGLTKMTTTGGSQPTWSPDGKALAYNGPWCYWYGCQPTIFIKVGTEAPRQLFFENGERPAWSPDGRRISFDRLNCDYYFIECSRAGAYVVTADGIDVVRTVNGEGAVWRPVR